jgi:hypothetical protein
VSISLRTKIEFLREIEQLRAREAAAVAWLAEVLGVTPEDVRAALANDEDAP